MAFGFRVFSASLLAIAFLLLFEEWASTPSCTTANPLHRHPHQHTNNLNVMIVADLLLPASDSSLLNHLFRHYYMSKFFRKSFETLRPDLLLVLGDVSARGSGLTRPKWVSVLRQFYRVLGPFVGLPFHAVLGDRDVGECRDLDAERVSWLASKLPGLDSAGCAAFEMGNVSFVTLNAVALLCGNCGLRFEVERVVERESVELRVNGSNEFGSGPVVLLHFPLDRTRNDDYADFQRSSKSLTQGLNVLPQNREVDGGGPYDVLHTLPLNASEYILQALKPRQRLFTLYEVGRGFCHVRREVPRGLHLDYTRHCLDGIGCEQDRELHALMASGTRVYEEYNSMYIILG
ncbi:metallophosphoesterase 1-like [Cajanus cajan]|uniref:metallophosphoesterase 1-like n=1 Tax=Cajanus cajan TaxID=3821 RepID=UPI0010FB2063|nr:metallophosphoesterase 1-like [Cajanus cajan]